MSLLGDAFQRKFGGEARSFGQMLRDIEKSAGSVTGAAREVGVDRRTWQRWRSGKIGSPRPERMKRVEITSRMARMPRATPSDSDVRVNTVEPGGRKRTLRNSNLKLDPGTMDRTRQTWIESGDKEATARTFRDGMQDEFYRTFLGGTEGLYETEQYYYMGDYLPDAITVS